MTRTFLAETVPGIYPTMSEYEVKRATIALRPIIDSYFDLDDGWDEDA